MFGSLVKDGADKIKMCYIGCEFIEDWWFLLYWIDKQWNMIIFGGYWRSAWTRRSCWLDREWSWKGCWGYTWLAWLAPSPCSMLSCRSWLPRFDARWAIWTKGLPTIEGATRWSFGGCLPLWSWRRDWGYGIAIWRGLPSRPTSHLLSTFRSFWREGRWNLWEALAYPVCRLHCSSPSGFRFRSIEIWWFLFLNWHHHFYFYRFLYIFR